MLNDLTTLTENLTINVVTVNLIKNHSDDPSYFTAAFPTLFSYGTGKHKNNLREVALPLSDWVQLLFCDSSRYAYGYLCTVLIENLDDSKLILGLSYCALT